MRITKKVHCFAYEGVRYFPGDELEIPERLFRDDFMVKVTPSPKPKKSEPPKEDDTKETEPKKPSGPTESEKDTKKSTK